MQKCKNCNSLIRDNDKYCRNCGIKISSKAYVIICNIYSILLAIAIIGFAILVIVSFLID